MGVSEDRTVGKATIDHSQPLLRQIGALGPNYSAWVHAPEPGQPRFFRNHLLEACSKTPWWVVPLVWLPLFTYCLACAVNRHGLPLPVAISLALVGVVGWQLLEYVVHRFVFHANLKSPLGCTFHFLFHGCHHKFPMDKLRLVFPPVPASLLVVAVYGSLVATLPYGRALAVFAGMGYGYVSYDCLHYWMHHAGGAGVALPGALLRDLRRRHMDHHYRDYSKGYGISSAFFDILFCTAAD
ncbi:hypothetical protein Agub_g4686 [Astrephomene gubernaculifera]|uniref:Fatty acid hydroxylase domain-containing protein n=1 Tax=Astrephomene gubernaculifera TaxID=47775 RepID=A0AAD3DKK5_9CHLO|nr:hypothetical protein Agub_g4686 [Astrephomene gubernaculifera]